MLKNSWQKGGVASKIKSQQWGGEGRYGAQVCVCAAACSSSWLQSSVKNEIKRARFNQSAVDEASASSFSASLPLSLSLSPSFSLSASSWLVSLASFSHAPREPWEPDKNAHTLYRSSRLSQNSPPSSSSCCSCCCSSSRFSLVFLFEFLLRSVPLPATARDALRDLKIVAHTFRAKNTEKKGNAKNFAIFSSTATGRGEVGRSSPSR